MHHTNPTEILLYQIKNENVQHRLNTVRNISIIAQSMGKERTLSDVIPLLLDCLNDEEEVLFNLAEEIPNLLDVIGNENVDKIIPHLQEIAKCEEVYVREKAVASLVKIIGVIEDDKEVIDKFMPMVKNFAEDEWFTPRITCCSLIPHVYPRVNKRCKRQLREIYQALVSDDTPMVRRASSSYLSDFVDVMEKHYLITDAMALFATLSQDEQDTVRVLSVKNAIAIGKNISDDQKISLLLPVLEDLSNDASWKVRYELSKRLVDIVELVFSGHTPEKIIEIFLSLIKDSELEVRAAAGDKASVLCKDFTPEDFLNNVLPALRKLLDDESSMVRASLASDINNFGDIIGKENVLSVLIDIILSLLRDSSTDVRLKVIENCSKVSNLFFLTLRDI
eukprot:TRINITY_DN4756_c0_g1_i1.p1 TRINITY_DN4756_c0_g1~~TRINITY_DN4756_c0_g1_i1.p1  ORF type:complete len:393 (+),score=87.30 TRINITY_DN4756_c0_g1_i1:21-1199(+)